MKGYPGHTLNDFFGPSPMTAAQFFCLHAQLVHENETQRLEREREERKAKQRGNK